MEAEHLTVTLLNLCSNRPWPLDGIYSFYLRLCHFLDIDSTCPPTTIPAIFKNLRLSEIQTFIDIVDLFASGRIITSPEECCTKEEVARFWKCVPDQLVGVYNERCERTYLQLPSFDSQPDDVDAAIQNFYAVEDLVVDMEKNQQSHEPDWGSYDLDSLFERESTLGPENGVRETDAGQTPKKKQKNSEASTADDWAAFDVSGGFERDSARELDAFFERIENECVQGEAEPAEESSVQEEFEVVDLEPEQDEANQDPQEDVDMDIDMAEDMDMAEDQDMAEEGPAAPNQVGGGINEVLPPLVEPEHCQLIDQMQVMFPRFNMYGRRVILRVYDNIQEAINNICAALLQQVMADDFVQITVRSDSLPTRKTLQLSFRRASQFDPTLILQELEDLLYDDELISFFLGPLTIEFHVVRLPAGNGRAKKRSIESFETFCKSRRSVIEIANTDNLCLPRSIVVSMAYEAHQGDKTDKTLEKRYKSISHSKVNNAMQKKEALALCAKAGVITEVCGTSDSLLKFRSYLKDYLLLVYQYQHDQIVLVSGELTAENASKKRLFLLNENNHYNVIRHLKPLFSKDFFCDICLTAYVANQVHKCKEYCFHCYRQQKCTGDEKTCDKCLRTFTSCFDYHLESSSAKKSLCEKVFHCKECFKLIDMSKRRETHVCNESYCTVCKKFNPYGHKCFIQVIKDAPAQSAPKRAKKDTPSQVYVFYDFECIQNKPSSKRNAFEHQAILCVSEIVCVQCMDEMNSEYQCTLCGCFGSRRQVFFGENAASQFLDYLRTLHPVKSVCLLCHNSSGYDNQLLLKDIMAKDASWLPEVIVQGTRIIQMKLFNLNFLDSLNFLPFALSKFAATFSLGEENNKGYFPHFVLNVTENNFDISKPYETNYVLETELPPKDAYGSSNFTVKDKAVFDAWYETESTLKGGFNFLEDMKRYCCQDVNILRRGCLAFRKIFMDIAETDPFQIAFTIAGVCSVVYRKAFMAKDSIGVIPEFGYRLSDRQSKVALEWLAWTASSRNIKIDSAMNGKEPKIFKFKVDGLCGREIFFFHGCFFHGCPDCFVLNRNKILYGDPSQTFNTRFSNTMKISNRLKGEGYRVTEIFECEWTQLKKRNPGIKTFLEQNDIREKIVSPLNPRDAFFGGRVSTLRTYHSVTGTEKLHYIDVTSLYPWVLKYSKMVTGHPEVILDNIPDVFQFDGLLKCDVIPPTKLYHPVLPIRANGKLIFGLCNECIQTQNQEDCHHTTEERTLSGTWVVEELRHAVLRGYIITKKKEAWSYKTVTYDPQAGVKGLFTSYVNCFLQHKQQASGWPSHCKTEEEKADYIKAYQEAEGITLIPEKIEKNEGLRAISKLLLNSFWGKFGQRTKMTKTEIIKEPQKFFDLLLDGSAEVQSVLTINQETLLAKWIPNDEIDVIHKHVNVVIAAYTTAMARLALLKYLEDLQELVVYYDTDSIVYLSPEGPPLVKTGDFLGQMTNELENYGSNAYITEFISGGPKNYSYNVYDPDTRKTFNSMKVKGFRINVSNQYLLNTTNLKALLGVDREKPIDPIIVPIPRHIARLPDHTLISIDQAKTYRTVVNKVRVLPDYKTVPYGYRWT